MRNLWPARGHHAKKDPDARHRGRPGKGAGLAQPGDAHLARAMRRPRKRSA
jgi:hypothetical protein